MDTTQARDETKRRRTALVAGATGLIGGFVVEELLAETTYREIRPMVRRPFGRQHAELAPMVVDFDHLDESTEAFAEVDDIFCCLGTTIKKAGSKEAFRKVDHEYVVELARLGRAAGARRFLLVSSVGAEAEASNFYLSVKGETEAAVASYDFSACHVFRPSLLTGPREESRPGERLAILASHLVKPILLGPLRRYRPIEAKTVATAMVAAALDGAEGHHVHTHDAIVQLAAR